MHEGKHRIAIVEGQTLLREGLRVLISSQVDWEVVGEGNDGQEAIHIAETLKPDLMLLALAMPKMNGFDALKEIRRVSPGTRILLLAVERDEETIFAALKAGAHGYELKDATSAELFLAMRGLLVGENFLCPAIANNVVNRYLGTLNSPTNASSQEVLSVREREVLKLIAEGYRTIAIGDYLCISPRTVEKHRATLMKKLDLHSVQALTTFVLREGVVAHRPDAAPSGITPGGLVPKLVLAN